MSDVATTPPAKKPSIPSPCIGVCEMIEESGLCAGCARSHEEIDTWRDATDAYRQSVWQELPERLQALGVTVQRLNMTAPDILAFIEDSVRGAKGSWVLGVYGGVGEFMRDEDEAFDIVRGEKDITALTKRGAVRFNISAAARLLSISGTSFEEGPRAYCLAVHRSLVNIPVERSLTELGADKNAIRPEDREARLFDIGLGRTRARFCVRTRDPELLEALRACEGASLSEVFQRAGSLLLKVSPTRVVETTMGRVEVDTPIPPPDGKSPTGPHTHLMPEHLAQEIDGAPGLAIPKSYAAGAIFYPKRAPILSDPDVQK